MQSFDHLSKEERKNLSATLANIVAVDDETDRLHAAHPELSEKVRVVSYNLSFVASTRCGWFWTNRGKKYKATYEIATPNDGPQLLTLDVHLWSVEGKYLTGAIGEDWTKIGATYRNSTAMFASSSYGDPGQSAEKVNHCDLKSVFRHVATDAGLLVGDVDEDEVLKPIITAFLGDQISKITYDIPPNFKERRSVVEVILMELEWDYKG